MKYLGKRISSADDIPNINHRVKFKIAELKRWGFEKSYIESISKNYYVCSCGETRKCKNMNITSVKCTCGNTMSLSSVPVETQEIKELYSQIMELKKQIKAYDRYENKINQRELRHTVSFYTEDDYDDDKEKYKSHGRIGLETNMSSYTNIYMKERETNKEEYKKWKIYDFYRPRKISNKYDNKPGTGTYKYTPEQILIQKQHRELIKKVFDEVWSLLTPTQQITLKKMLIWFDGNCKDCKYNHGEENYSAFCAKFGYRECWGDMKSQRKGYYNHGRYIYDYEVAEMLGKTKSAVSHLIGRLNDSIKGKYEIHPEDYSFLFDDVN